MKNYVPDWFEEHADYWRKYYPNAKFLQKQKGQHKEKVCYLALAPPMGDEKSEQHDTVILLGDSFIRSYYTTFCRDTMQVAFAKKIEIDCKFGAIGLEKDEWS